MTAHWEGRFFPIDDTHNKSELKWGPVQRWLPRPQFLLDERVFVCGFTVYRIQECYGNNQKF